jgi:hypothetical protein
MILAAIKKEMIFTLSWSIWTILLNIMNKTQAQAALKRILKDPGIADQYTEEEIEKIEELAARK